MTDANSNDKPREMIPGKQEQTNWHSVLFYYAVACAWSWPFFWWRDIHPESWKALPVPNIIKTWSYMWGPGISALICFLIFKNHKRITTLRGASLKHGLLFYSLIPISLTVWNKDLTFLLIGLLGFISILGEELGWRGFLQDALKLENDWSKAILVGVMWEAWHFTNRIAGNETLQAVKLVSIWMVGTSAISYIALKLTNRNHSLFLAVALHTAINVLFEFNYGWQAVLSCVPFWALILWNWPQNQNYSNAS
jgi:uncharacterized protein